MKHKIVTDEIYNQIDKISCALENLKNVSYILAESMMDSPLKPVHLEALATLIHERLISVCKEFYTLLPEIEPDDDD